MSLCFLVADFRQYGAYRLPTKCGDVPMSQPVLTTALVIASLVIAFPANAQPSAAVPRTLTPPVIDLCSGPAGVLCSWGNWAIGKQSVALIADVKNAATYVICRQAQITDPTVDLMTVVDAQPFEVSVGAGGQIGFRAGNCLTVRGKKIYLTTKGAGVNKYVIRGWYRRLDAPGFNTGYGWYSPRNADGKPYSFAPVLYNPASMLTRLCFFSDVTDPNDNSTDYARARRVLISPTAYLNYYGGAQINFAPGSCVDLEYSQISIDPDWVMDGKSDVRGALFYQAPPIEP